MASLNDLSAAGISGTSSKPTHDLSTIFASSKKVVLTSLGSSRLLCFDQVFAYLVNVTKDKVPTYTCIGVLAFSPFSDDGEILDIKVNADLTKAILVGKRYIYCFSIPDPRTFAGVNHRLATFSHNDELMENKVVVTLETLGAIPNSFNILKVKWLPSSAVKKTYRFADFIGILYSDSTIRVIDVKYPQKEHILDFKPVIHGSVKEDQFKGFGMSKVIVSFSFGPIFSDKNFITVFAVDNESEIYYTSFMTLNTNVKVNSIVGPALYKNKNSNLEPMDIINAGECTDMGLWTKIYGFFGLFGKSQLYFFLFLLGYY
jgi:hypothetical protein